MKHKKKLRNRKPKTSAISGKNPVKRGNNLELKLYSNKFLSHPFTPHPHTYIWTHLKTPKNTHNAIAAFPPQGRTSRTHVLTCLSRCVSRSANVYSTLMYTDFSRMWLSTFRILHPSKSVQILEPQEVSTGRKRKNFVLPSRRVKACPAWWKWTLTHDLDIPQPLDA